MGCTPGLHYCAKVCRGGTNRADQDENLIHIVQVYIYKCPYD